MKYDLSSIPTFIGFYEGKMVERFAGANKQKLESLIFTLEKKIHDTLNKNEQANLAGRLSILNVSFNLFNANRKDDFVFLFGNFDVPIKKISK